MFVGEADVESHVAPPVPRNVARAVHLGELRPGDYMYGLVVFGDDAALLDQAEVVLIFREKGLAPGVVEKLLAGLDVHVLPRRPAAGYHVARPGGRAHMLDLQPLEGGERPGDDPPAQGSRLARDDLVEDGIAVDE